MRHILSFLLVFIQCHLAPTLVPNDTVYHERVEEVKTTSVERMANKTLYLRRAALANTRQKRLMPRSAVAGKFTMIG